MFLTLAAFSGKRLRNGRVSLSLPVPSVDSSSEVQLVVAARIPAAEHSRQAASF